MALWVRRRIIVSSAVLGVALVFAANWAYQVTRKPTEILAVLSGPLSKAPRSTWESYGAAFRTHSTEIMTAEFLAALAQVESQGNPLVGTAWRWRWSLNPLEVYRPASSAVGLFQITEGTFDEMRRYCIRDHKVAEVGPWHDLDACWFTGLYTRLIASHAIEMTSAYLHRSVEELLAKRRRPRATLEQKQMLAGVIHLCGIRRGDAFVQRGLRVAPGERCGSHSLRHYLAHVRAAHREFARLSAE